MHVEDTGEGRLSTSKTVELYSGTDTKRADTERINFVNEYQPDGELELTASKTLTGRELEDDQFSFVLYGGGEYQKVTNDGSLVKFTIAYDEDDIDETYTYYVSEINEHKPGYSYDSVLYSVEVFVEDDGEGHLIPTVTSIKKVAEDETVEEMVFANEYHASGELDLEALKTVIGKAGMDIFTFELSGEDIETQTVTNDTSGMVKFDTILYDEKDIGKEFTYQVVEKVTESTKLPGYKYSEEIYTVKVNVTDNGDGTLTATPSIINHDEEPVYSMEFVNEYSAEGNIVLEARKSLADDLKEKTLKEGDYRFQVTEDGKVVATGTNDADGKVTFSEITYETTPENREVLGEHTYEVSEVPGNDKTAIYDTSVYTVKVYVSDKSDGSLEAVITSIVKDNVIKKSIDFVNDFTKAEISKKILGGADTKELEGAVLQIEDADGNVVVGPWTSGETAKYLEGVLEAGKTYYLVENTAPAGYVKADKVEFTVNSDGSINQVEMFDDTTKVVISKVAITGGPELPGASLQVIKQTKDGSGNEEVIDSWTSTEDVHLIEAKLVAGETYVLREISAPEGYLKAADVEFTVNENGEVLKVEMVDDPTKVEISKVAITGGAELPGATLQVIKRTEDTDGKVKEVIVEEWTSTNEVHTIEGKLTAGEEYILREITAPDGYNVANDITFKVNEDGTVKRVEMVDESTKVSFSKKDITGSEELPGATLQVIEQKKAADGKVISETVIEEWVSGKTPHLIEAKLKVGASYVLRETAAPDGYTIANDVTFTVEAGGKVQTVEMRDDMTEVVISKTDITTGKELPGATLQILKVADGKEEVVTLNGEKLEWVSTEEAKAIKGLPAGDYILREISAPYGYTIAEDVKFTISEELTAEQKVVMENKPTEVSISKRKMVGISELPGASLKVLDEKGEVAVTIFGEKLEWVSGEEAKVFKGLKPGKYTLVEVKAPDGYAVAESVAFEVTDGKFKVKEVIMRDDTTKVHISKMDVTNNKELAGARLVLKDSKGNVIAEWTSTGKPKEIEGQLIAGETYTLSEISAPVGYDLAKDITFTVNSDGEIQKVVMEDKVSDGDGSITVQKLVMRDGKYTAVDYTFYVALFADEACTQRISNVKPIYVNGSYTGSTIFTKLQYGTYYVAETDEAGNAISEGEFIEMNQIIDGKAVLTPANATAKSTIINHMTTPGIDYYEDGEITVDKRVLINGVETNVDDTFYFALFVDADLTMMADAGVQELKLTNSSRGTVVFENLPYGVYYLAETDEDGVPVDDNFEYTVTISSYCNVNTENRTVTRTVTNSKTEKPDGGNSTTTTTTSTKSSGGSYSQSKYTTGSKPVQSGDDTPIMEYVMLLGASAIVLLGLYGKKRRKRNNA